MIKNPSDVKLEKCKQEIYKILDKHNCGIIATPIFDTKADGTLKIVSEVKVISIVKPMTKPERGKYIN